MLKVRNRKGVAAVEAAVCMPLLVLIFFGSLEVSGGIFQEYNAQTSAFELAKVARQKNATCDDVQDLAALIMPQHGFSNYDITIVVEARTANAASVDPPNKTNFNVPQSGGTTKDLEDLPRGTLMRLTLTADRPAIAGMGIARNFLSSEIVSDCVFVREF